MHYRQLRGIDASYSREVGTSGHRTDPDFWKRIETRLKTAIVDLKNASVQAPVVSLAGNTIVDRKNFFEAKQRANSVDPTRVAKAQAADKARKEISFCRRWLSLEGASADDDGNVIMAPMGNLKIYYDDTLQSQGLTRVYFFRGRIYKDSRGITPFNTKDMVTHFSGPGKAIFVMSGEGNFHIKSHVLGHYHHSSLLGGQPVACAGEIEVKDGYVTWLSNKSGHYVPNALHLVQVLHQLQKNNVNMNFPIVFFTPANQRKAFTSVGAFLADRQLNGEPDYEYVKLMAYDKYLYDGRTLASNNWRWRNPNETVPGVYDMRTGQLVPPKRVRTWLKQNGYLPEDDIRSGPDPR